MEVEDDDELASTDQPFNTSNFDPSTHKNFDLDVPHKTFDQPGPQPGAGRGGDSLDRSDVDLTNLHFSDTLEEQAERSQDL